MGSGTSDVLSHGSGEGYSLGESLRSESGAEGGSSGDMWGVYGSDLRGWGGCITLNKPQGIQPPIK